MNDNIAPRRGAKLCRTYTIAEVLVALGVTGNVRASERLVREGRVRLNDQLVVLPFELWPSGHQALSLNGRRCTLVR